MGPFGFRRVLVVFLVLFAACDGVAQAQNDIVENILDIDPVTQQTLEWCWLAVGGMIFDYLGLDELPSGYQCSTIGLFAGPNSACFYDCSACPVPAGTMQNLEKMIVGYPQAIDRFQHRPLSLRLTIRSQYSALSWADIKDEIDHKRPIVVGINPLDPAKRAPAHVALIIGYKEDTKNGKHLLVVNDPAPYEVLRVDPYGDAKAEQLDDRQFLIEYGAFKNRLTWVYTAYGISDPSQHTPRSDLGASIKYGTLAQTANDAGANENTGSSSGQMTFDTAIQKIMTSSFSKFSDILPANDGDSDYHTATITVPYQGKQEECTIHTETINDVKLRCILQTTFSQDEANSDFDAAKATLSSAAAAWTGNSIKPVPASFVDAISIWEAASAPDETSRSFPRVMLLLQKGKADDSPYAIVVEFQYIK